MVLIKVVSFNVRGLGGWENKRKVHSFIREKFLLVVYIQETKMVVIDDFVSMYLWGSPEIGYSFRPFVGASGGLLTL